MRSPIIAVILSGLVLGVNAQRPAKLQLSQLPDGKLSGNIYINDALGLSYQFPDGWAATADPKTPTLIDWRNPDKPANRCSKVLLEVSPASPVQGRFNPNAIVIAFDPDCLHLPPFPNSVEQMDEIKKVAVKVGKAYSYTSYSSPYGNAVHVYPSQGRLVIQATGGLIINAIEGNPAKAKEPLEIKTSFSYTDAGHFWVAWAFVADVSSAEELNTVRVVFSSQSN